MIQHIIESYLIENLDSSKEAAIISSFSDNVQYQIREPLKVLLITNEDKQLPDVMFKSTSDNK